MPHFVIVDFACVEINNYCRPEHGILVGLVNYVAALTVLLFHISDSDCTECVAGHFADPSKWLCMLMLSKTRSQ